MEFTRKRPLVGFAHNGAPDKQRDGLGYTQRMARRQVNTRGPAKVGGVSGDEVLRHRVEHDVFGLDVDR